MAAFGWNERDVVPLDGCGRQMLTFGLVKGFCNRPSTRARISYPDPDRALHGLRRARNTNAMATGKPVPPPDPSRRVSTWSTRSHLCHEPI